MPDAVLLVNPAAGSGRGMAFAVTAAAVLRKAGIEVDVLAGRSAAHSAAAATQLVADGCRALIVCGGDGLVHLALQAVARSHTALGIIPAGTGNDVARALGLPLGDPAAAAQVITSAAPRFMDLGRVGDRWFGSVLAVGFDSRVNDRANRLRWPHGKARFHAAVALELPRFRPLLFTLDLDGRRHEIEGMLVAVGNGGSYGGGMRICPAAELTDGLFEVTVVTAISTVKLLRLFPSVYPGTHVERPEVLTFRAAAVTVDAPSVDGYADGERIGPAPLRATVVPGAVRVWGAQPR
jgi:diacylglycerol kinase (ATP)